MLIKEVCETTKLTKKAIEYYIEQDLIFPNVLENGYRDFSTDHIELLKKISVLRKLGLGTDDIKLILLDENGETLQKLSLQKELRLKREMEKQSLLDKLSMGRSIDEIITEIKAIEQKETITEKLLYAFPGYYGRFIALHFSPFLNEIISRKEQEIAYEEIVSFLDNVPALIFPKDLQEFLTETTNNFSTQNIIEMNEEMKQSIKDPEDFLCKNKEVLDWYLEYKQSDKYKNSPTYKIQEILKEFNNTSGYYDIFIPAMKKLSKSYSDYSEQLEIANEKLLFQYPEIQNLSN